MGPQRVLVTGVYGLIAGALYQQLRQEPERFDAWGLARRRQPSQRAPAARRLSLPEDRFVLSDLQDADQLAAALEGMDVVVHLAADPRDDAGWDSILANNVAATRNVYEAAHRAGVGRVVYASSVMVSWGYQQEEPYRSIADCRLDPAAAATVPVVTHEWPVRPTGLYPASKVWGEALGRYHADVHGMSVLCVRIGWVNAEDTPWSQPGMAPIWCSQRDTVQLLVRAITAPAALRYDIYYAVSNNQLRWVDIDHARQVLGYLPQDAAQDRRPDASRQPAGPAAAEEA